MAAPTKTFGGFAGNDADGGALSVNGLNSTGYTHVVVFCKHEGASTTLTPSDNKGTTGWQSLTKESHTNGDLHGQLFWAKIGSPGSSHNVTVTPGANRPYKRVAVWFMNSTTGEVALVAQVNNEGTGNSISAGTLATGSNDTASFMGVGEYSSFQNFTNGTGWAIDWDNPSGFVSFGQSRTDTAGGSIAASCTDAGGAGGSWSANAASFREESSGTTYNDPITESATPGDSNAAALTANATRTESAAPADSNAAAATLNPALAESATPADSMAGGLVQAATIGESATPADSNAAAATFNPALPESVTAVDNHGVAATINPSVLEAIGPADAVSAAATVNAAVNETAALADSYADEVSGELNESISESVSPADSYEPVLTARPALQEQASPIDSLQPQLTMPASVGESAAPGDNLTGQVAWGVQLIELAAPGHADVIDVVFNAPRAESASPVDAYLVEGLEAFVSIGGGRRRVGGATARGADGRIGSQSARKRNLRIGGKKG